MAEQSINVIILCSWGATSSQLAKKVQQAAEKRGITAKIDAGGTGDFKDKASDYDVALLEPQVRHLRKEVTRIAEPHNVPVEMVDQTAFALMNGDKVLDQVLQLME
ncbi:PTS sugar transporter subunit IIB [Geomicrobium sp. JCM 19039]|uniref:PTS sugar transporter subunit IIB n=1 Tax=Geomicrobium sp. JCM 19039 TaxID=1460636 RepID=UPI00045F4CDD|nr:PTS sugar transporter subunit IIB [Geomicrobium sp. JCM 19039]GAK12336.1 PTS system, cellobiose-specific IIB component [Geomicrobium sp. JCM 19039]